MAKQPDPIIINEFYKGLAQSGYLGFQELRCLDITSEPGIVKTNKELAAKSDSTTLGFISHFAEADNDVFFLDDDNNKVYTITVLGGGIISEVTGYSATPQALVGFWDYLAMIGSGTIDWYDPDSSEGWTDDWYNDWTSSAITNSSPRDQLWGIDGNLYIAHANSIDKIETDSSFDPDDSNTYTISKAIIKLPKPESIQKILEFGNYIMIVGDKKIYKWDRVSSNYGNVTEFSKDIQSACEYNNRLYVAVDDNEFFVSNGTTNQFLARIPKTLIDDDGVRIEYLTVYKDLIYFFLESVGSGTSPLGVWSLNPNNGALNFEHLISTGEDGSSNGVTCYFMGMVGSYLVVAWGSDGSYDFDLLKSNNNNYDRDEAFLVSQFYRLGIKRNKAQLKDIEIQLAKELTSGDNIKIYGRTKQDGSWTELGNPWITFDAVGEQSYIEKVANQVENLQLKVVVDDDAELIEVRINYE